MKIEVFKSSISAKKNTFLLGFRIAFVPEWLCSAAGGSLELLRGRALGRRQGAVAQAELPRAQRRLGEELRRLGGFGRNAAVCGTGPN